MAKSLTETVTSRLRQDILRCALPPGARLLTGALCARFDVSLAVVREALSRLVAEGLVVAEPQRSFRVAPISVDDLHDLTWLRIEIETLALRRAIARATLDWESAVVSALHRLLHTPLYAEGAAPPMNEAPVVNEAWAAAHAAFHLALAAGCGSPSLLAVRASLFDRSERYRRLSARAGAEPDRDLEREHRGIAEAALRHEADAAAALLARHLELTAALTLDNLALAAGATTASVEPITAC